VKTVSIMEAQHNLSRVLKLVESGHEVGITRRKKVVARLLPPRDAGKVHFPDFSARARDIWGGGWQGASSDALLQESRGER
jgi:antitoxin (DNA-binding transcriptional repressor) of toxin-antitoxin stability system